MKPTRDYCRSRASCLKCCVAWREWCLPLVSSSVCESLASNGSIWFGGVSGLRRNLSYTRPIKTSSFTIHDAFLLRSTIAIIHLGFEAFTCPSRYSLTIEWIENKHKSHTKKSDKKEANQQVMDSSPQQGRKRKADDHDSASKSLKRSAVFSDSQVGNLSVTTASSSIS